MCNNTTQLFLIPLTCLRSKNEYLYGNSGIHHRKFTGWVSLFSWLGVRYQLFPCLLLSGADGQAVPGRATTSLYNLLLPGAPQVHKEQVKAVIHQLVQVWPLPISLSPPVLHHKGKAAESAPIDQGLLLSWSSASHSCTERTHNVEQGGRLKLSLFAWRHKCFYHHLLMQQGGKLR